MHVLGLRRALDQRRLEACRFQLEGKCWSTDPYTRDKYGLSNHARLSDVDRVKNSPTHNPSCPDVTIPFLHAPAANIVVSGICIARAPAAAAKDLSTLLCRSGAA